MSSFGIMGDGVHAPAYAWSTSASIGLGLLIGPIRDRADPVLGPSNDGWAHPVTRFAQTRPPPDLAIALVRTVCYAWTTTARFHNPVTRWSHASFATAPRPIIRRITSHVWCSRASWRY